MADNIDLQKYCNPVTFTTASQGEYRITILHFTYTNLAM